MSSSNPADYFNYHQHHEQHSNQDTGRRRSKLHHRLDSSSGVNIANLRSQSPAKATMNGPKSPGIGVSGGGGLLRSPNPTSSLPLSPTGNIPDIPSSSFNGRVFSPQQSTSESTGSSAKSSRRSSLNGLGAMLGPLTKTSVTTASTAIPNYVTSPGKYMRGDMHSSTIDRRRSVSASDSTVTTPTLVIPPELASFNIQGSSTNSAQCAPPSLYNTYSKNSIASYTSSTASNTPANNNNSNNNNNNNNSNNNNNNNNNNNGQITNNTGGANNSSVVLEPVSSSSSTRSFNMANASSMSLRTYKKQYMINEKLYLEKMKNNVPDDYYTRGIEPTFMNEDDEAFDYEVDDMIDNNDENNDDFDFGTNFFTATTDNKNLVSMSSKYLLHRIKWLKQADPTNESVGEVFKDLDEASTIHPDSANFANLSIDIQERLAQLIQHPLVLERFEWQTMLSNVLKGDIVKSEKTKIANEVKPAGLNTQYTDDIWLEIKAWMNGRTVTELKTSLEALRDSTDALFQEILTFKVPSGANEDDIENLLRPLISRYYKVINYWGNLKQMQQEKPVTKSEDFISRIEAMNSWLNCKSNLETNLNLLRKWVGNEELDVVRSHEPSHGSHGVYRNTRSFAEQIMKEKDIETIFQKKIFYPLAPWILKAKLFFLKYEQTLNNMNIEYSNDQLKQLLMFPMRLVKEIIIIRLKYAKKLQNPTMMMIDQMIDDFSSYIRLSVQLKYTVKLYCSGWSFNANIDPQFDNTVIEAIQYLFTLLNLKLLDWSKMPLKTFKEPDELLKYWEELKNVGHYIDGAGKLIAKEFNKLSLRLLHRLHIYLVQQQNYPPSFKNGADAEKWLVQFFENLGSMKRKLNRFTNVLTKEFQNSTSYNIQDHATLLQRLKESGHFLIYTGGKLEKNGMYILGSPELLGCEDRDILNILHNSDIGCDLIPKLEIRNSLTLYNGIELGYDPNKMLVQEVGFDGALYYHIQQDGTNLSLHPAGKQYNKSSQGPVYERYEDSEKDLLNLERKLQSLGYILVLCPAEPMLWEGEMYNLSDDTIIDPENFSVKINPNSLVLMNQGASSALKYQCERFQNVTKNSVSFIEKRCSFPSVENDLQRINKAYFRFTYSVLNNYPKVLDSFTKMCPENELLNSVFLFSRDFGRSFLRTNVATYEKKSVIILLMVKLSIAWLSFLVEDCNPTDQRTFRWCVAAMEFAMQITNGYNILSLDEKQFALLKQNISSCMSLLISHFDVMGARANEAEKTSQQIRPNIDIEDDLDDDSMLQINSELRVGAIQDFEASKKRNPHQIGRVLDDKDTENKYLLSLASSLSNVSMRWQKRNFIGGGTFGTVYSGVNLDNGEILAVKEIKIQDSQTMKKFFPQIKEEMVVLEMLNHPNIVQYYGVEVHRDKVNIFMEYCEGGSLAALLEHGRIEDEMVTQVYTLQLLEGLAYLHQSGVVHRDIKPENILLDYNGIIKYVDFGAARKIARNGTLMSSSSKLSHTEAATTSDGAASAAAAAAAASSDKTRLHDMVGTPMYMAPESITGSSNTGKFGADDVWSLGCVVLEMITGRRPWANLDNEWAIMYHVAAGHLPQFPSKEEVSPGGLSFLQRCLVQNPNNRATAVELLMDLWIVQIRELAFGNEGGNPSTVSINTVTEEEEQSV